MKRRLIVGLLLAMLVSTMFFVQNPAIHAQDPIGEGMGTSSLSTNPDQVESPNVNDYLWIAGSSFKPRSTATQYGYMGNGCIYSRTGGSTLNQSFTASFRVPNGSTLRGLRFFFYDTAPVDSRLSITSYDGAGGFIDHVFADSTGTAGADSVYVGLSTPYTIDTSARGFVINWYPNQAGSSMRLCAARIFYDKGTPVANLTGNEPASTAMVTGVDADMQPSATLASDYYFLAGSSFDRRDGSSQYAYGNSGCMYVTGGSNVLTIDLNIPDGSSITGARFFYHDTDAGSDIAFYLTDYNGQGAFNDFITGTSSGSAGYGSLFFTPASTYTVDQTNKSLNAIVLSTGATRQLCGVRVFYSPPTLRPAVTPEIAEQATAPTTIDGIAQADAPNAVQAIYDWYAQDMQLPQGMVVEGVRMYYYITTGTPGKVESWEYKEALPVLLGETESSNYTGYSSTYSAFPTSYTVDHFIGAYGVVPALHINKSYRFCGVRVFYNDNGTFRYRFVAGSAFHPRESSYQFNYAGAGCINRTILNTFTPLTFK